MNTTWNINTTTFIDSIDPYALFIDINNIIYIVDSGSGQIHVWFNNSVSPTVTLYSNITNSRSIFVTINGDIYIDNGNTSGRVDKLTLNSNSSMSVMSVPGGCYGLFVDISNSLYCSVGYMHQVVKKWLGDSSTISTRIAGTGLNGSSLNMFCYPNGIFVDMNFDLYVADYGNNRIQLFGLGKIYGKTVAGKNSTYLTVELNGPTDIKLDNDKNLYITDHGNHRIVASGSYGFRCIVGCSNSSGSMLDTLNHPRSIAFDNLGNLFVADEGNHRIQRFSLLTSSCSKQSITIGYYICICLYYLDYVTNNSNTSFTPCSLLLPCENQGTCINNITAMYGFVCNCQSDFSGINCQHDNRICRPNTCWNNGK